MKPISPQLRQRMREMLQTTGNNANPKMAVYSSRAKTTITDASYWTVETIRATTGLGDISVAPRRFKSYGKPNRLYEIHVKDGEVSTAIREYPDKLKQGWQPQFTLGPSAPSGGSVAIAFNGYWERYRKLWRLITEEKPWIFWVDSTGILWGQLWDDVATKQELATGVTRVRAIRAWKNVNIADQDQGVIVGYVKTDGTVWYRNYCQQADYSYTWENARQLVDFTGTAVTLNMFITNDYRMGFIIEDSLGQVHWLITPRNWAGMAIAADTISVAPASLEVDFIPIEYIGAYAEESLTVAPSELGVTLLYADTDNDFKAMNAPKTMFDEFDEPYEDWGWIIDLTIDHPIPNLTLANITATNLDNSTVIQMSSIEKVDDFNYRLHVSDVVESGLNNVYEDIQVDITGAINPAGYTYINMTHTFTPINLVPTFIPLPEVEVIYNE